MTLEIFAIQLKRRYRNKWTKDNKKKEETAGGCVEASFGKVLGDSSSRSAEGFAKDLSSHFTETFVDQVQDPCCSFNSQKDYFMLTLHSKEMSENVTCET